MKKEIFSGSEKMEKLKLIPQTKFDNNKEPVYGPVFGRRIY